MNPNKRFGSIARKIHRSRVWSLLRAFILFDIALAILLAAGFGYWAETRDGAPFDPDTRRRVAVAEEDFRTSQYVYQRPGGDEISVPVEPYLSLVTRMGVYLLWAQGAYLFLTAAFGVGKSRRLLRPLQKIADTAQRLSEPEPDTRIHQLENALHTVAPGARLQTNDPDLQSLEAAVNDMLDKMRMSYEEQTRFVSDASHELRTPIAVIQGYAGMLARWGKDDPQVLSESVAAIQSETERMKKLVEQLLFLARGDSGRQKPTFAPFDLSQMLKESRDECEMIDPDHTWTLDLPETPITCVGDRDMLCQALRVLTDNARKFTPKGASIRLRAGLKNNDPWFDVQDEGAGIAPEALPKIFDRFFRADPARGGSSGSAGLGLSIAKWIVERHRGYFDVLSRPGIGTRIRVVIPAGLPEDTPAR